MASLLAKIEIRVRSYHTEMGLVLGGFFQGLENLRTGRFHECQRARYESLRERDHRHRLARTEFQREVHTFVRNRRKLIAKADQMVAFLLVYPNEPVQTKQCAAVSSPNQLYCGCQMAPNTRSCACHLPSL